MNLTVVSPLRVRSLLLNALGLFSKGSDDGRFWVKGYERTPHPIVGMRYGHCSIGAINNVSGFTAEEKQAARIALAKMIEDDFYGGDFLSSYDEGFGVPTFESRPELADDLIVEVNDNDETTFEEIRGFFTRAAAALKR
jgi:hypothetical protein